MNILHLTLKKKWFDMIASGEKQEEYREMKEYWQNRLMEFDIVSLNSFSSMKKPIGFKQFDIIRFKNGYSKDAPTIDVKCDGLRIGKGYPSWGAEPNTEYFVIELGEVLAPSSSCNR